MPLYLFWLPKNDLNFGLSAANCVLKATAVAATAMLFFDLPGIQKTL